MKYPKKELLEMKNVSKKLKKFNATFIRSNFSRNCAQTCSIWQIPRLQIKRTRKSEKSVFETCYFKIVIITKHFCGVPPDFHGSFSQQDWPQSTRYLAMAISSQSPPKVVIVSNGGARLLLADVLGSIYP